MALAAILAAMLFASFPPLDLPWLGWLGLTPLVLAIRRSTLVGSGLLGLLCGTLFHALYGSWLLEGGITFQGFGLGALGCGSSVALSALGTRWLDRHASAYAVLTTPALWVLLEWLRVHLGWASTPWAQLGYSQFSIPAVRSVAAIAGTLGISFLLALFAVLLADEIDGRRRGGQRSSRLARTAAIAIGAVLLGSASLRAALEKAPSASVLRVAVLQAGEHVDASAEPARARQILERYVTLSESAATEAAELIVWPEASVPAALPADRSAMRFLGALARRLDVDLLIASSGGSKGSSGQRPNRHANSAFLIGRGG
jgi:apolipoprotein N-acyltransferase